MALSDVGHPSVHLKGAVGLIVSSLMRSDWNLMISIYHYIIITLWLFNIAMENGSFIDGLPIKNGDFPWLK